MNALEYWSKLNNKNDLIEARLSNVRKKTLLIKFNFLTHHVHLNYVRMLSFIKS
jgi:hypothetical protein